MNEVIISYLFILIICICHLDMELFIDYKLLKYAIFQRLNYLMQTKVIRIFIKDKEDLYV